MRRTASASGRMARPGTLSATACSLNALQTFATEVGGAERAMRTSVMMTRYVLCVW